MKGYSRGPLEVRVIISKTDPERTGKLQEMLGNPEGDEGEGHSLHFLSRARTVCAKASKWDAERKSLCNRELFICISHLYLYIYIYTNAYVLSRFSRLCDPMGCSPPGSSVHGILQARILEWVSIPSSRGCFQPRDLTPVS